MNSDSLPETQPAVSAVFPQHQLRGRKPTLWELTIWAQAIETMLAGGVPVYDCLENLSGPALSRTMNAFNDLLRDKLRKGHSLAQALSSCRIPYSSMVVHMIEAGEESGDLAKSFAQLSRFLSDRLTFRNRVVSALAYPTLVSFIAFAVLLILLIRVVPSVVSVFSEAGVPLPLPTRALIAITAHLRQWWWIHGFIISALVGWFYSARRWTVLRNFWAAVLTAIPFAGPTINLIASRRAFTALTDLIHAGVPTLTAINLAAKLSGNYRAEQSFLRAAQQIRHGKPIVQSLDECGAVPVSVASVLRAAEETGDLAAGFSRAAQLLAALVETRFNVLFAVIEPLLIVVMSIAVAMIAFAILLPVFEMGNLI